MKHLPFWVVASWQQQAVHDAWKKLGPGASAFYLEPTWKAGYADGWREAIITLQLHGLLPTFEYATGREGAYDPPK